MPILFFVVYIVIVPSIIMVLWEKSKRSEIYAFLNFSFILANGLTMYKDYQTEMSTVDYFTYLCLYFIASVVLIMILNAFISVSKEEGLKEIRKELEDYERLIDKKDLTKQESVRINYLKKAKEKNKIKYEEFAK